MPDLLDGLNHAQKAAVMHDGGPLVVLAGPGTGKTRVIVHRIAHAIAARAILPEHILAVTFTAKAAQQLRARLAGLLTGAIADRLHVYTFHGLGMRIIDRFPEVLRLRQNRQIIDSAQRRQLIRDLILEHNLMGTSAGLGIEALAEIAHDQFEHFWNHHLAPTDVIAVAQAKLRPLHDVLVHQRSNEQIAQTAHLERLIDIARLATLFADACRSRGWLSYGDLIALPIKLVESHPTAAAILRDQYRCLVVDEFQDVNASQIAMLKALAPPGVPGTPDLCVVGDDDQSIYEFRGADERAFAKFAAIYPSTRTITLTENYRSQQPIIDVSNHIIKQAGFRFDPTKVIERPHDQRTAPPAAGAVVQVVKLKDENDFADTIASLLLTARATEPGHPWRKYAVIARSAKDLDRVASALLVEGVPFTLRRNDGIASDAGVQDVLAWVRLLVDPTSAWNARRILMRLASPVPGDLVASWEKAYRYELSNFNTGNPHQPDPGSFVDFLAAHLDDSLSPPPPPHPALSAPAPSARHAVPSDTSRRSPLPPPPTPAVPKTPKPAPAATSKHSLFAPGQDDEPSPFLGDDEHAASEPSPALSPAPAPAPPSAPLPPVPKRSKLAPITLPAVQRFINLFGELRAFAAGARADEALLRIITLADIAHTHLLSGPDRAARVSALAAVITFARVRQPRLHEPGDLAAFLDYYNDLIDKDQDFSERDNGIEPPDENAADDDDSDAVNLITAHSSKGLEFDTVFVARVNYNGFPGKNHGEEPQPLPGGLIDRAGDARSQAELHNAGQRRLFYVACTRAERRLVIVGKFNKTASGSESNNYLDELLRDPTAPALISPLDLAQVERLAKDASVISAFRGPIDVAAGDLRALQTRRDILARARADARLEAAVALDSADRPESTQQSISFASDRLAAAAAKLAAIAALERTGQPPAWVAESGADLAGFCDAVKKAIDSRTISPSPLKLRSLLAPLQLSYTTISDYQSCPACFYVKNVLGVPEPLSTQLGTGSTVHNALDTFFKRFVQADNNGETLPNLADLLNIGDAAYFAQAATSGLPTNPAEKAQIRAHLTNAFTNLHRPSDHIVEHELKIRFPYTTASRTHNMTAKIDRLDDLGAGRYRIVDYKTGKSSKKLLTPAATDLQMGIYLMALRDKFENPNLTGTAEYWLLATGERGIIDLADLDLPKIKKTIDDAVAGMLAGEWPSKKKSANAIQSCRGLCELLGL